MRDLADGIIKEGKLGFELCGLSKDINLKKC